jgi:predicted phage tail protein
VGNAVTLAWLPPASGSAPFSYVVEAALSPGGPAIASLPVAATTLTVSNVPNGVYYVRVRALSPAGMSGPSNETVVVVPSASSCAAAPGVPTNFTATATGNSVTLAWSAPAGGCPATSYVVQAGSVPGLSDVAVVNVGGVTSLSAIALSGTYYVRVIALNAFGISSPTVDVMLKVGP